NVSVEDFDFGGPGGWNDIFEQVFSGGGRPGGRAGRGRGRAEPPANVDVEHTVTITFEQAARGTTLPLQINRDGRIETIDVKVPAGVKDGSRIRLRGKGGYAGGQHGDLYITTKVEPHPWFRREDLDLYLDLPVSLYEAVLGAKVEAPTLDGPVSLTIPPGTGSGAKLRIRGRGVERAGQRGDQFVVVRVMVPKDIDAEDKRAIEQIARKHPMNPRAELRW
ncbi:MAG: J domain-containing protein, partial [Tepidisphaeraceae bacterium]